MILCLVTDRRRLGQAIGIDRGGWIEALRVQVGAAAAAGIDLVQVREPDLEAAALVQLVRALVADTQQTTVRIVVNDRLDVALAAGAAGVHLKERSFAAAVVRCVAPSGYIVGRSIHGISAALAADEADYFVAGTVLATASKPSPPYLGWPGLAAVVQAARGRPVLAVGGIDTASIAQVAASGAAGVAAIGAFIPPVGQRLPEFVRQRVSAMRLGFDSAHPVS